MQQKKEEINANLKAVDFIKLQYNANKTGNKAAIIVRTV